MKLKKITTRIIALAVIPMICMACGSSMVSTSSSSDSTAATTAFPSSLAVASPFGYSSSSSSSSVSLRYTGIGAPISDYKELTGEINDILTGASSSPSMAVLDMNSFYQYALDAECYGPKVLYVDHPDDAGPGTGELPTGDVGIWLETDPVSGDACAAAQLEARLEGVSNRSNTALVAFAVMINEATAAGKGLPDASNPTVDVKTEMNALGITDTNFLNAQMTYDSVTGAYAYTLDIEYTISGVVHGILLEMEHLSTGASSYEGTLSFMIDDNFAGGHCSGTAVTINGSVQYEQVSATELKLQAKTGMFCGHGSDGRDATTKIVDESLKMSGSSTGWANDFDIFTGNFDPADLDGDYSYAWQAGYQDDNTRVININVSNSGSAGFAFYGYGDEIEVTDGSIDGFICNWAGPGNSHTIIEQAQYQEMSTVNNSDGTVTVLSDAVNIGYAPTVSCDYTAGAGFIFDTDADGLLSDESDVSIVNDLFVPVDVIVDGIITIEENIDDAGFVLPTI